jgi:hypothetical protein
MSFVLGNAYKGKLFSLLTNQSPPPLPRNIQELTSSTYPVLTTSFATQWVGNELVNTSVLRDAILRDLMQGVPGKDYPIYYQDLNKTVQFVQQSLQSFIVGMISGSGSGSGSKYVLPASFALLNSESDLTQALQLMSRALRGAKIILQGGHLDSKLIIRTPWIAMRNFFQPLFSSALASLYESGIYEKWRLVIHISGTNEIYAEVLRLLARDREQREHINAKDTSTLEEISINPRRRNDGPRPLSLSSLHSIFRLALVGSIISVGIYICELFRKFLPLSISTVLQTLNLKQVCKPIFW